MKAARIRNNKKQKKEIIPNEEYSFKNMLIIVIIIVVVFFIFYFITALVLNKPEKKEEERELPVILDSSKITLNNLLNRKEDEYFVLATKKNESVYQDVDYSEIYASHIKNYNNFGITIHNFYYVDLNDALNKNYIGDKVNITDDLEKLKVNDDVLFKIKNKKIEASYVGNKKIIEALTNLVPKSKES